MATASAIADEVLDLLLSGRATDAAAAERLYLTEHEKDIAELALSPISDEEFRKHPLIVLLMMHGSRGWEDSLA